MTISGSGMPADSLYPPFLKHDCISRIDGDLLFITDRRKLPFVHEEVCCRSTEEVAAAIRSMVTQGGGPLEAALNAMRLAYRRGEDLDAAASILSSSRPTNTTMARTLRALLADTGKERDFEKLIDDVFQYYDDLYDAVSDVGAGIIEDGDGILTRCFPEHTFMLSLLKAVKSGKDVKVFVPETRPYLQGARLTEPSLRALGIQCFLITDAMNAHFMAEGRITKVMTASDLALSDRTVVNKVGTLSDAVSASYYHIPYYAFSLSLDKGRTHRDIVMEERSGMEMKNIGGSAIAEEDAVALYPAFDIIPPELVSGIITKEGVL